MHYISSSLPIPFLVPSYHRPKLALYRLLHVHARAFPNAMSLPSSPTSPAPLASPYSSSTLLRPYATGPPASPLCPHAAGLSTPPTATPRRFISGCRCDTPSLSSGRLIHPQSPRLLVAAPPLHRRPTASRLIVSSSVVAMRMRVQQGLGRVTGPRRCRVQRLFYARFSL